MSEDTIYHMMSYGAQINEGQDGGRKTNFEKVEHYPNNDFFENIFGDLWVMI